MLRVKKEYENTNLSFKVGVVTVNLDARDITEDKIKAFKNHIELSHYVEEVEIEEVSLPINLIELQEDEVKEIVEVKAKAPRKKAKK